MNELPPLSEQNAAATNPATPPEAPQAEPITVIDDGGDIVQRRLIAGVIALGLLLGVQTWSSHNRIQALKEEVALSLKKGDASNTETTTLAKNVQEQNKELQAKVTVLENRQSEAQSQQLALEQLYQDLSKNRDEWALAEIEQVLSTASQQLQLSGNVQGALIALANADRSLSRSDKPQFITIRRAIAKDIDKLKALPGVDLTGVALRLDNVVAQIDTLPMLSDEKPVAPAAMATAKPVRSKGGKPVAPAPETMGGKVQDLWTEWSNEMWVDVRSLIRVRNVDTPEALMMSPTQAYFMRENLKLRLLNARLALLSRNETAFRNDLIAAQDALVKYFDTRARSTQTAQALLRQVQSNNVAIDMPTLVDSLNAVRNYKAKP
ncbi:MAG: uroporphyrinogen-III C-methyltransferase [Pseudomonadota bacterium]